MPPRPSDARDALTRLARGAPGLVVVAHPDDETIGLGGHLYALPRVTVLHLTDGAPHDPRFARHAGFESSARYREARRIELARALTIARLPPARRRSLGLADQDAAAHLVAIARAIHAACAELRVEVVLTHAYEGGHPDHDAAAFASHAARALLGERAPLVVEMPFYHRSSNGLVTGAFVPSRETDQDHTPFYEKCLEEDALAIKQSMLACFASQRDVLAAFDPRLERFRVAPRYDFAAPPHRGPLHYETLGWWITGAELSTLCTRASAALAIEGGLWRAL